MITAQPKVTRKSRAIHRPSRNSVTARATRPSRRGQGGPSLISGAAVREPSGMVFSKLDRPPLLWGFPEASPEQNASDAGVFLADRRLLFFEVATRTTLRPGDRPWADWQPNPSRWASALCRRVASEWDQQRGCCHDG